MRTGGHKAPVQQDLPHHGTHAHVVNVRIGADNLVEEVGAPPPRRGPKALVCARQLPLVVRASAALEEAAVPLEPAVGVLGDMVSIKELGVDEDD